MIETVSIFLTALTILLVVRGALTIQLHRRDRRVQRAAARAELEAHLLSAIADAPPIDHVPARLTMRGVVPAGGTATIAADPDIVLFSTGAVLWARSEARRGPFLPRQILIDRHGSAFKIVDVRCGGRTQFASGTGGVPADMFDPRYADMTHIYMDTLAPSDAFEIVVKNDSDRELAFAAAIDGQYAPPIAKTDDDAAAAATAAAAAAAAAADHAA